MGKLSATICVPFGAETVENDPCTVGPTRNYTAGTGNTSARAKERNRQAFERRMAQKTPRIHVAERETPQVFGAVPKTSGIYGAEPRLRVALAALEEMKVLMARVTTNSQEGAFSFEYVCDASDLHSDLPSAMARHSLVLTGSLCSKKGLLKGQPRVISRHPFGRECASPPLRNYHGARVVNIRESWEAQEYMRYAGSSQATFNRDHFHGHAAGIFA